MRTERVELASLGDTETFRLSFPVRPERHRQLMRLFPGLPALVATPEMQIVFGIDSLYFLKEQGRADAEILITDVSIKEGLLLNLNLKRATSGLNLYEKLVLVKKILPHATTGEMYERSRLDLAITPEVIASLDILLDEPFSHVLTTDTIDLQTALRIAFLKKGNRKPLIALFERIPFTRSQRWKILDMVEEILAGTQHTVPLDVLFRSLRLDRIPEGKGAQQSVIDLIAAHRYPQLTRMEENWRNLVRSLDIPDSVRLSHYPNFEKNEVDVRMKVKDLEALSRLIEKIKKEDIY